MGAPTMSRQKPKSILRASGINDFRPGSDAVAMLDGKAHVVSLDETYAPVPVDESPVEVFRANAEKLTARMSGDSSVPSFLSASVSTARDASTSSEKGRSVNCL